MSKILTPKEVADLRKQIPFEGKWWDVIFDSHEALRARLSYEGVQREALEKELATLCRCAYQDGECPSCVEFRESQKQ